VQKFEDNAQQLDDALVTRPSTPYHHFGHFCGNLAQFGKNLE
jgi:hypothetical protein